LIYELSDPHNPVLVGEFAELGDLQVSWGINYQSGFIVTSMVDNPLGIPYDSDWGGIQIYEQVMYTGVGEQTADSDLEVFPNPVKDELCISGNAQDKLLIYSVLGKELEISFQTGERCVNVSNLSSGICFIVDENQCAVRFVKL
jgi:hypothetical protein